EPCRAARPRAPGAPELSLRPPRRPRLLARGVGHVARHAAPTPRGVARRTRPFRPPRAPSPSLSPRRQDQDEPLSAESSPSPEVPYKVTGIAVKRLYALFRVTSWIVGGIHVHNLPWADAAQLKNGLPSHPCEVRHLWRH